MSAATCPGRHSCALLRSRAAVKVRGPWTFQKALLPPLGLRDVVQHFGHQEPGQFLQMSSRPFAGDGRNEAEDLLQQRQVLRRGGCAGGGARPAATWPPRQPVH